MDKHIKILFAACVVPLFLLTACAAAKHPTAKPVPQLTFSHLNPYKIKGGAVRILPSYTPDAQTVAASQALGYSPAVLLENYARNRFVTGGAPVTMIFDIKQASLSKNARPTDPLLFMTGMEHNHYKLDILIEMAPLDEARRTMEPYTVYLEQKLVLSPDTMSLAERDNRKFQWIESAMVQVDRAVSNIVTTYLQ